VKGVKTVQKITPFLWFDSRAEDAAKFYISVFTDSRINAVTYYGEAAAAAAGRPRGSVMTVAFEIQGQEFVALNGGPVFEFSPAVSFVVNCESQEEVDRYWEKLSEGGEEGECGWLTDRFGVSWQIVPIILPRMLQDRDPAKSERVMKAMLQMKKLDLSALKQAYDQA
jgi:predicted 3-demethylubiquinone-9 3-methyltransferase (glyoxalase superfamily)